MESYSIDAMLLIVGVYWGIRYFYETYNQVLDIFVNLHSAA